jgi:hypothetical protein
VLVLGGLAAKALAALVRRSAITPGNGSPEQHATVTQVAVWVFSVVIGLVGALALAGGLAFGLGGRDRAARLLDRWAEPPYRAPPRAEPSTDQMPLPLGSRIHRSGYDRRRITRDGPDRRTVEGVARG